MRDLHAHRDDLRVLQFAVAIHAADQQHLHQLMPGDVLRHNDWDPDLRVVLEPLRKNLLVIFSKIATRRIASRAGRDFSCSRARCSVYRAVRRKPRSRTRL